MVKDGIVDETVEEMTLTITPDSDDDSEDEDLIDEDDRQIIDRALERLTETDPQNTSTCTNPRRDLTETIQRLDYRFLELHGSKPAWQPFPVAFSTRVGNDELYSLS